MNFFEQQDLARRNTRMLVLLFLTAVLLLVLLTNVVVAAFLWFGEDYNIYSGSRGGAAGFISYFSWGRFGSIGLGITAAVALVVFVKWLHLSTGGKAVAESLGGTRILPQTRNRAERRCLHVVEEMALAANMPVPPVYVMQDERGINAFAAGITPADAVVAVTRGTIDHLKRHELQGVIAHEFSHILNGDMRLNIRLAAMLKGITFVGDVGHLLLRSGSHPRTGGSRRGNGAALPLLGLALWLLGLLGGLAAGFIKAAISRQKEYLADASAVQYTRSADGIADALKVIGGYIPGTLVHSARAVEMSHIFFGQIEHRLWQVFATHPPLDDRIRRIDANWDGKFIERKIRHYQSGPSRPGHGAVGVGRAALVAAVVAGMETSTDTDDPPPVDADFEPTVESLEAETAAREQIPLVFVRHSREPLGAQALVFSLLIHPDPEVRTAQLTAIRQTKTQGLPELVHTIGPGIAELGAPARLPLLEMCLPALKSISADQYRVFKNTLVSLIRADARTDLYEWCMFQLIRHYLDPEFVRVRSSRPRFRRLRSIAPQLQIMLSVIAYNCSVSPAQAFTEGAVMLELPALNLLPPQQCGVAAFSKAATAAADCYPLLKPRILKALAATARNDGQVLAEEREIIASIAAVMDCPVPLDILGDPDAGGALLAAN